MPCFMLSSSRIIVHTLLRGFSNPKRLPHPFNQLQVTQLYFLVTSPTTPCLTNSINTISMLTMHLARIRSQGPKILDFLPLDHVTYLVCNLFFFAFVYIQFIRKFFFVHADLAPVLDYLLLYLCIRDVPFSIL